MKKFIFIAFSLLTYLLLLISCSPKQSAEKVTISPPTIAQDTQTVQIKEKVTLIQGGQKIPTQTYTDIAGKAIPLYGTPNQQTLIMFSFIGCAGCEVAMRKMKQKNYALKENIQLYYSSPQDSTAALLAYLQKKEFPFTGFAEESLMQEDFEVIMFPTFALIDSEGIVQKVAMGYNEEIESLLFY